MSKRKTKHIFAVRKSDGSVLVCNNESYRYLWCYDDVRKTLNSFGANWGVSMKNLEGHDYIKEGTRVFI